MARRTILTATAMGLVALGSILAAPPAHAQAWGTADGEPLVTSTPLPAGTYYLQDDTNPANSRVVNYQPTAVMAEAAPVVVPVPVVIQQPVIEQPVVQQVVAYAPARPLFYPSVSVRFDSRDWNRGHGGRPQWNGHRGGDWHDGWHDRHR